ncbi:MAG: class I tRNA ligase family protein, partial [Bacilli bacterium]
LIKAISWLEENEIGIASINYKLRDWVFARQRYWGEPFPIIHYEDGSIELVAENQLPLILPEMDEFKPSGTGESPLANAKEWLEVTREDGVKGRRDTNTMPQWAGSCWYYIGYLLKDADGYANLDDQKIQERINNWLPVDLYIGGAEHAVLHLLYARFWHKVLYDCGIVKTKEPFQKLYNQGMILGENGVKMSKSLGNVINPNDIIESHGADALRLYEMFMGPLDQMKQWSTNGLDGALKFIERVYRLLSDPQIITLEEDHRLDYTYHNMIKNITNNFEQLAFNTSISELMIFINEAYKTKKIPLEYVKGFLAIFYCITPHVGAQLWQMNNFSEDINTYPWPSYDQSKLELDEVTIVVQVNSKVRAKIIVPQNTTESAFKELAYAHENVITHLKDKEIVKEIFLQNKILNIVVK